MPDARKPWLVAIWPGMGGVAQIAGHYLAQKLGAAEVAQIPPGDHFEVQSVQVEGGLLQPAALPVSRLLGWKNPGAGHDLLIFLGEKQPERRGFGYCEEILRAAESHGIERVFTFAAMATPIHPEAAPRVFGATTRRHLLEELQTQPVELLNDGEISGLNGVFLAAASTQGIGGTCLLGEFPFFASAVPNPKASAAVLRVFGSLAGIDLDLMELDEQGEMMAHNLAENLTRLQEAAGIQGLGLGPGQETGAEGETAAAAPSEPERPLDPAIEARIEGLFQEAADNRAKALELKAELDRHGLFRRYEDRFLDLFKRGE